MKMTVATARPDVVEVVVQDNLVRLLERLPAMPAAVEVRVNIGRAVLVAAAVAEPGPMAVMWVIPAELMALPTPAAVAAAVGRAQVAATHQDWVGRVW
ncbi:MAG: hypothetical protein EBT27_11765 [Betaproteobacteria bacterium]|nr:hypothetical protein [Betaproteobacteria bacterium]